MATHSVCGVSGCRNQALAKNLCRKHYAKQKKYGNPLAGREYGCGPRICAAIGCESAAVTAGLCKRHYHKKNRYGDPNKGSQYRRGERVNEERLWLFGNANFSGVDCLVWPFQPGGNGYGVTLVKIARGAHRAMCTIAHGPAPSDQHEAAHSCNNRICVNPSHLRWATKSENMHDKTEHGTQVIGEKNHAAKLSNSRARELLNSRGTMLLREAAAAYGLSIATVQKIWTGSAWKWLQKDLER